MDELQSAIQFLVNLGGKYPSSIESATRRDGQTLPYIKVLTPGIRAALLEAGWQPPLQEMQAKSKAGRDRKTYVEAYKQGLIEEGHEAKQVDREEQEHEQLRQHQKRGFGL